MRTNPRRAASWHAAIRRSVMALAASGLIFASVACDNFESDQAKADKRVKDSVDVSTKNRRQPTTKNITTVVADLSKAVGESAASDNRKLQARSMLAQTEYEQGDKVSRQVLALEPAINRAMWDITLLAGQIKNISDTVDTLGKSDPAATLAAIDAKRKEFAAASAAADTKAKELQGQIDQANASVAQLVQQQTALRAQAADDRAKAAKLPDKDAAALLDSAGEANRKAENLAHDIFKLTGALENQSKNDAAARSDKPWEDAAAYSLHPLQRDLAAELDKKKSADAEVAKLDQDKKAVDDNWTAVKAQIEARKTAATTLGQELSAKVDELAKFENDAGALRDSAIVHYDKSVKGFLAASGDAQKVQKRLDEWRRDEKFKDSPEAKSWDGLYKLYNYHYFKLLQGRGLNQIGNLKNAYSVMLDSHSKTAMEAAPILTKAGIALPAKLGTPPADAKKTQDEAIKNYDEAIKIFEDVFGVGSNPKTLIDTAKVSNLYALFSEFQLTGDTKKRDDARKQFNELFGDKKDDPGYKQAPEALRG